MPSLPDYPRAIAFFDGQNLYYGAKEAFGYPTPNYDVSRLRIPSVTATDGILPRSVSTPAFTTSSNTPNSIRSGARRSPR